MKHMKTILIILAVILAVILSKMAWTAVMTREIGSFESERTDLLQRRNFLLEKVVTDPQKLIDAMPAAIGEHFQGEWGIYSASMLSAALVNMSSIYPETRGEAITAIDSLIRITMSPELRRYDALSWGEDPLETLDGDNSHISYISLLAWMISGYKTAGGDGRYDALFDSLCGTIARRLKGSSNYNLPSFPGRVVYVPDVLAAIAALSIYARMNGGRYRNVVDGWLANMKKNHTDPKTGLLLSVLREGQKKRKARPVLGSYTALSVYYLTFVDEAFAREQYDLMLKAFYKRHPFSGLREKSRGAGGRHYSIDSGPILFGLSPSGTAFGIGGATYFRDKEIRERFLKTAELAGFSVKKNESRHYLLADLALVGEAITLAMRTAVPWYDITDKQNH